MRNRMGAYDLQVEDGYMSRLEELFNEVQTRGVVEILKSGPSLE